MLGNKSLERKSGRGKEHCLHGKQGRLEHGLQDGQGKAQEFIQARELLPVAFRENDDSRLEWPSLLELLKGQMSVESIDALEEEEKSVRGKSHLHELENRWRKAMVEVSDEDEFLYLVHHNRFRLRNISSLREKRPGILLGYINDSHFPNFHTVEILKVADMVSLTLNENSSNEIDRIRYDLVKDDMNAIRKRLPKGFSPAFFWDMQAVHGHVHPRGLSCAPFPSVASICHVQQGPAVKTICEMFDFVLPVGKVFSSAVSYGKASVLHLPFGFNWASFHRLFKGGDGGRDVDVSITFTSSSNPAYHELRNRVTSLVSEFQKKWAGRFRVEVRSDLAKEDYKNLLERSKISLNVVGINGPFNYRSCEIVNSGALLFQTNVTEEGLPVDYEGVLEEGKHFVSFTLEDLESQLLDYLGDEQRTSEMAFSASAHLKEEHSYEELSKSLISKISEANFKRDFSSLDKDEFWLGTFLWQQYQKEDTRLLGAAFIGQSLAHCSNDLRFFSNCLAILPELARSLGFDFLKKAILGRNEALAESLDPNNLKQIAVQLFTLKVDHVATCYNFLSLSLELQWSPPEMLRPIAEQAFVNKEWPGFSGDWILRPCGAVNDMDSLGFQEFRHRRFHLPLLKVRSKEQEWVVYRDYLLALLKVEV